MFILSCPSENFFWTCMFRHRPCMGPDSHMGLGVPLPADHIQLSCTTPPPCGSVLIPLPKTRQNKKNIHSPTISKCGNATDASTQHQCHMQAVLQVLRGLELQDLRRRKKGCWGVDSQHTLNVWVYGLRA